MTHPPAVQTYREVMTVDPPVKTTPFEQATHEFVFGQVWPRPGLSRRDRRWVTLTCVAAADSPQPIDDHVYAALNSEDMSLEEMLEFVLQFAVYCGWPKASHVEGVIRRQWVRIRTARGEDATPWPMLADATLGPNDWAQRLERGVKEFEDVNGLPAPKPDSPYTHAGILSYVFGHVWQRPGLSRRDRRLVTVASVAVDDSPMPLIAHVGAALQSGDITKAEMDEVVLQFSAYYGFAKGEALQASADDAWARLHG
ncbi:4-carboxymuconolactone decarboxylase [Frankia sp. Hr75.2]|uniref:carboxymuconolactone decarboxylase family protein n=2 Tax=unclassified Parafrankia TaxID=2994368 RepID=UPI000DA5DD47|nr:MULTISPECIES: carboxymuconolactone decarboxylase family protein [unclassified Parafrankia]CAI7974838.1 4-carboxymuconolactone decarboxylase [Frankia sp. Hr75.2]SQE00158.1 Carboxymuconolactone decarboxylase [Parafrankia sp. Ea1.12]